MLVAAAGALLWRLILLFQSSSRGVELCLHRVPMMSEFFLQNEFIGPVGTYNFHFISGPPSEKFTNPFTPFDTYLWGFLLASTVSMSAALVSITKIREYVLKKSSNRKTFDCM